MTHLMHSVVSLSITRGGLSLAVSELTTALAKIENVESVDCVSLISSIDKTQPFFQPDQVKVIIPQNPTKDWRSQLETAHRDKPISLIHQHGIWVKSSNTSAAFARSNKIPLIISPHGMLEPWPLQHHAFRKKIAMCLYQKRNLQQAVALQATCESEAEHIRDLGFTQPIAIIPNGVSIPEITSSDFEPNEQRTALFLSRLHPKKGIPMLLEAWSNINPPNWKLIVSGNNQGHHLDELKALTQKLGLSSVVSFPGHFFDKEKSDAFQQADLFVLPSHSENFGIVITEALAYGLPVITTRETPWQILEQKKCGWWVDASADAITTALKEAFQLEQTELHAMGQRGKGLVEEKFLWPKIAKQMLQFYHWVIDEGDKPDYVI